MKRKASNVTQHRLKTPVQIIQLDDLDGRYNARQ